MNQHVKSKYSDEQQARMAFLCVPGIGRQTVKKIEDACREKVISPVKIWNSPERLGEEIGLSETKCEAIASFKKTFDLNNFLESLHLRKVKILFLEDTLYPSLLKQTSDPPLCLFYKGSLETLCHPPIAIVGTRRATGYGKGVTESLATQLTDDDACVVSGCMVGIDAISHQVALKRHKPTIGVLGYGFDYVYPQSVSHVLDEIVSSGNTLFSEYPPATPPNKGSFPERNRIVAGLSLATVVPEAAEPSGSFITVRHALDYGRPVCAVPGPMTSIYSEGTKALINQGATLVTSAAEIWKQVEEHHLWSIWGENSHAHPKQGQRDPKSQSRNQKPVHITEPTQQVVYDQLLNQPLGPSDLIQRTEMSLSGILLSLTMLEMNGLVRKEGDLWYIKNA